MDFFAENACPTPRGIVDSLTLLRKCDKPFAEEELATRLDLLLLPFLSGIQSEEQRVSRLGLALNLAADRLPPAYEVVYRQVFLDPADEKIEERRTKAVAEIGELFPSKSGNQTPSVKSIESRLLPLLAEILLDPEFEQVLDSEYPEPTHIAPSRLPISAHAFEPLAYTHITEFEDNDRRKKIAHRIVELRTILPDQRVAGLRYFNHASNPKPVDDGVTMLSPGHTYLDTFSDTLDGSATRWMMHFIHLGQRKEPGDVVVIDMREQYFDEQALDPDPSAAITVYDALLGSISLAVRLPKDKLADVRAESRVIDDPHVGNNLIEKKTLKVTKDGWVREKFTKLEVGLQYGIFFPGFDLYK